jgi:hypothetical protein
MAFRSARLEDKDNRTIACLLCEHTITAEVNLVPQNMWYMAHDYQNENPPRANSPAAASLREPSGLSRRRSGSHRKFEPAPWPTLSCMCCARGDLSGCVLLRYGTLCRGAVRRRLALVRVHVLACVPVCARVVACTRSRTGARAHAYTRAHFEPASASPT